MAIYLTLTKRTIFFIIPNTFRHFSSTTPPPPAAETVISTVVSILKHHRSKSRWGHLRSLFPAGFHPSQFSQITLQLRNNPHLALRFFLFTIRHSLCDHSLLSYATIIHILARARLKSHAQTLIQTALRKFQDNSDVSSSNPPKIFEVLIRSYRTCDSAPFVFDLLIKACLQSKRIDQSIEIARMLRSKGINPMISTCNSLIVAVCKYRGANAGYDVYTEMFVFDDESDGANNAKLVSPNIHTLNIIMLAYYRDGSIENVERVWSEMKRRNCVPTAYSYNILMAGYSENGRMEEAMRVWEEMGSKGLKHDVLAYNTIIGGFCKTGEVSRAEELAREMLFNELDSTTVTFEHLINGYCKIGDVDSVMFLYKDMKREGFTPENSTIDAMVRCFCEKSRIAEALDVLRGEMRRNSFNPNGKSYEALIKGLCNQGRMDESMKLQAEMVGKGYQPNLDIYAAFINGYEKQGKMELVGKLKEEMLAMQ